MAEVAKVTEGTDVFSYTNIDHIGHAAYFGNLSSVTSVTSVSSHHRNVNHVHKLPTYLYFSRFHLSFFMAIASLFSFGAAGLVYAGLGFLTLSVFLLIPSLFVPGARPFAAAKAVYCYLMQALGVLLLTFGGLPAVYAVLEKLATSYDRFTTEMYVALLIVFAAGGITYLWHETVAARIDQPSKRVPAAIFHILWKAGGYLFLLGSVLYFFLTMLLARESFVGTWWILPTILFFYGILLSWLTRDINPPPLKFHSAPTSMAGRKEPTKRHKKKK